MFLYKMQSFIWDGIFPEENSSTLSEQSSNKKTIDIEVYIKPFNEKLSFPNYQVKFKLS